MKNQFKDDYTHSYRSKKERKQNLLKKCWSKILKRREKNQQQLQPFICVGCAEKTSHTLVNDFNLHVCSEECLDTVKMQLLE